MVNDFTDKISTSLINNWIKVSIFYNRNSWHLLISNFIKPFIQNNKKRGRIKNFIISFNNSQGDNIRLAFEYVGDEPTLFKDSLVQAIFEYLELNFSKDSEKAWIGEHFFMDFPNNSIEFNLYDLEIHKETLTLQSIISDEFMNSFSDIIDESTILSFQLYILMVMTKAWVTIANSRLDTELSARIYPNNQVEFTKNKKKFELFLEIFNENRETIMELYEDIFFDKWATPTTKTLLPFYKHYSIFLSNKINTNNKLNTIYFPLDSIIAEQMNIANESLLYVYYLLYLACKVSYKDLSV